MFTGLVEEVGRVRSLERRGEQARLELGASFSGEVALGDSVAVNGCCLTVAEMTDGGMFFDVLAQTLEVTSLGGLEAGSAVNLERALRVGDRLGGHLVQGHVDGTGEILELSERGQDFGLRVGFGVGIREFCIDKGSLTVDGISLTIASLGEEEAEFWITPHTYGATNLGELGVGRRVNLEVDLIAKYVKSLFPDRR